MKRPGAAHAHGRPKTLRTVNPPTAPTRCAPSRPGRRPAEGPGNPHRIRDDIRVPDGRTHPGPGLLRRRRSPWPHPDRPARRGATTRRDRYAAAAKLLVARIEYPYRIRRRTSDAPEALNALAGAGHDLQERLAETRVWISTESTVLSDLFGHCLSRLDAPSEQACTDAWNVTPVTAAAPG